ncbi:GxxExxY protein [Ginsengibacter hankyongi]|uniref:GxxExxY protein n=1 Tax=Ginsengibacter hankyongi TaxID=2607284 RepID=A0A5J5IGU9_9BACT|nr:GxxExxY protein [Ginsengibacter hankyongi]KAA9039334.1 GxxExxY protein [Ginsengibacter hankyongi]
MAELLFKEESFKIIGICMEIHKTAEMGLKEINYKDAMEIEFIEKNIPFEREKRFSVKYKEKILRNLHFTDFLLYDCIILKVKSVAEIIYNHLYQTLSYLSASQQKLGMVINFGEPSLTWKRIVF